MAQLMKVGNHATTQGVDDDGYRYTQYRATKVVRWDDGIIILNTGGWFTRTTRNRMNQTSNQFGLGFRVFVKKRYWFVRWNGNDIPFAGNSVSLNRFIG